MKLIAADLTNQATDEETSSKDEVLSLANTAELPPEPSAQRIELSFPKFTDGRAFSQAVLLRRAGFKGDIRATGDVLVDQLLQMQRCGFTSAVLRADQNPAHAERILSQFAGFYQGDALQAKPLFARPVAA